MNIRDFLKERDMEPSELLSLAMAHGTNMRQMVKRLTRKPKDRPQKPAPRDRRERVARKRRLQAASCNTYVTPPRPEMVEAYKKRDVT